MTAHAFVGQIAGVGSSSGVRIVVGAWDHSPLGGFVDVMLADACGKRWLLAPTDEVARFVSDTYTFDEVVVGPVDLERRDRVWRVDAPALTLHFEVGARPPLGWVLRVVPSRLARHPDFTRLTDPIARRVMRGVRTRGTAGGGRIECYAATDLRSITHLAGTWAGSDLGDLAPVRPDPGFGFGSTPQQPGVTTLTTTVIVP